MALKNKSSPKKIAPDVLIFHITDIEPDQLISQ